MKTGYMTNAWGSVVGHPAGVTSIKDLYYLSTGKDEEAIGAIAKAGFDMIEIFDGNLVEYAQKKTMFLDMLKKHNVKLLAVYTGADFIFDEIFAEELHKIESVADLATEFGAKHLCVGGGAIRSDGIRESDFDKLAANLDRVMRLAADRGLIASYHPHLGTMVQSPEQLDKLMPKTKISLCPDCGHIAAGGGNPVETVRKYRDRIRYIHLKDYKQGGFYPLGKGSISQP